MESCPCRDNTDGTALSECSLDPSAWIRTTYLVHVIHIRWSKKNNHRRKKEKKIPHLVCRECVEENLPDNLNDAEGNKARLEEVCKRCPSRQSTRTRSPPVCTLTPVKENLSDSQEMEKVHQQRRDPHRRRSFLEILSKTLKSNTTCRMNRWKQKKVLHQRRAGSRLLLHGFSRWRKNKGSTDRTIHPWCKPRCIVYAKRKARLCG